MADWIFQGNRRHYDLDAAVAASREQWWGTPRYRDRMVVGDRVWLQIVGPKDPGIYYAATIISRTYEAPPSDPARFRWRTDIRFDYRISPPLLRFELLEDVQLGSFRPFRGFQGSNVPVPPDVAATLAARADPRMEPLGGSGRLAPGPDGRGLRPWPRGRDRQARDLLPLLDQTVLLLIDRGFDGGDFLRASYQAAVQTAHHLVTTARTVFVGANPAHKGLKRHT
jgi:hypothetical protein